MVDEPLPTLGQASEKKVRVGSKVRRVCSPAQTVGGFVIARTDGDAGANHFIGRRSQG